MQKGGEEARSNRWLQHLSKKATVTCPAAVPGESDSRAPHEEVLGASLSQGAEWAGEVLTRGMPKLERRATTTEGGSPGMQLVWELFEGKQSPGVSLRPCAKARPTPPLPRCGGSWRKPGMLGRTSAYMAYLGVLEARCAAAPAGATRHGTSEQPKKVNSTSIAAHVQEESPLQGHARRPLA